MNKYRRLPLICLLLTLFSTFGQAYGDAPVIWAPGGDAKLLNSRGLLGADGTVYPRNYLGPKNYLAQGSSRTTGWGVSGAQTLTPVTTGLPEPSVGTGIYIAPGAVGDYAYFNFKIDPSDSTVQQKISWAQLPAGGYVAGYQKADVYSCTVAWSGNSCVGTSTRLPLTTDASAVTGISGAQNFVSYFAAPSFTVAPYLQLRVTTVTATGNLTLSSVYVGPGQSIQGPNIGPSVAAALTTGGFGTTAGVQYQMTRTGQWLNITGRHTNGTVTSTNLIISLPAGLTIDTSVLSTASTGQRTGQWELISSAAPSNVYSSSYAGVLFFDGSDTSNVYVAYQLGSNAYQKVLGSNLGGSSLGFVFSYSVPIAQWAGSGTVNLAQNDVQYVFNTSTTTANDTTSFGYGPAGALIQAFAPTGTTPVVKRVQFLAPLPVGASPFVETDGGTNGASWTKLSDRIAGFNYTATNGTTAVGFRLAQVSATQFDLAFFSTSTIYTGDAWSNLSTWRWRVSAGLPGQAVGFAAYVPGQSSGLVPAVGLPGVADASSGCSGCVGEYVVSKITALTNFTGSGVWTDCTSITLSPGDWDITLVGDYNNNAATGTTYWDIGISTTAGNNAPGSTAYGDSAVETLASTTNSVDAFATVPNYRASNAAQTTYYGKMATVYSTGTPRYRCRLSARRMR